MTLPIRFAIEDATSVEAAAMLLVTKKIVPNAPSGKLNLRWKKYVIQELSELVLSENRIKIVLTAKPSQRQTNPVQTG